MSDERFTLLVMTLQARLGRLPTEEEVTLFLFGTHEDRNRIWGEE